MDFGKLTLRRSRLNPIFRQLTSEVDLNVTHFMQPIFCVEGLSKREEIPGLSGVFRETETSVIDQIQSDYDAGVRSFLLFGVPKTKSSDHFSYSSTASMISNIKNHFGDKIFLAVDVCLCSYTEHGHCGVLSAEGNHVDNGRSVTELAKAAAAYAEAGADCVAPSDMMDGRIAAIRAALEESGNDRTLLMSYSAKFHSKFYGPFRVAANSAPSAQNSLKDRASYQIDPARPSDAFLSSERDAREGADLLMVKPGLPYLDLLSKLSSSIPLPWAVYEVSGEYAAIELLGQAGLANAPAAHVESWIALKRAGASIIISYGSRHAQTWLKEQQR
jgi:porphobilinogen synthase